MEQRRSKSLACPHTHIHPHLHIRTYPQTDTHPNTTHTFLQSLPHGCAQSTHFWVALCGRDEVTDSQQGVLRALLQVQVQELVLLSSIHIRCDCLLVTFANDIVMYKVQNNFIGIHFLNESLPKLVKDLLSFMEGEEIWYTNLLTAHVHYRTMHPPPTWSRITM